MKRCKLQTGEREEPVINMCGSVRIRPNWTTVHNILRLHTKVYYG